MTLSQYLCLLSFALCYFMGRRSLVSGLVSIVTVGYAYGIVRANVPETFSHFIFDSAVVGCWVFSSGMDSAPSEYGGIGISPRRVAPRYRGEPNPIDRVPGRIPGALNAPWNDPLPALPEGELVTYCGSGVTSCVTLHRLALAGREGKLYPGSWSEWEQRGLPVERD